MRQSNQELLLRTKVLIIFIENFIFWGITFLLYNFVLSILKIDRFHPWYFRLFIYILYFVFSEFYFKKTLLMKFFNIHLTQKNMSKPFSIWTFIIYTIFIFLDRFVLVVFYMFGIFMLRTEKGLLISERFSGLRWLEKR